MAHFAEIDPAGVVIRVVVIHNDELLDDAGLESEAKGAAFCRALFGGTWVQTSYNATRRKNFAGEGYAFDSQRDAFIPPKPFPSWVLDEDTCRWQAPVPYPSEGGLFAWNEATQDWVAHAVA
jgi:hypothetical protein